MKQWQGILLGLGSVGLLAGAAQAALGLAQWSYYRSDLIRCIDAAGIGIPTCGDEGVGDDPLRKGRVTINGDAITVQVIGAAPESLYVTEFIPLRNTGETPDDSYEAEDRRFVGLLETNRLGTGTLRTDNDDIIGPQIGYFLLTSLADGFLLSESTDPVTAQSHEDVSQFVTGFDPEFVERD